MVVVDASVVLDLLLQTAAAPAVTRRLFTRRQILCAPHLIDLEVLQVLRRYVFSRELNAERGMQALEDFLALPITRYPHTLMLRRMWQLRQNLSAYDAAYVALAEVLVAPLLTRDSRLATTSPHHDAKIELL